MLPLLMSSVEPATLTSLTSPTVCVFVQWSWHEMTLAAGGCPLEVVALVMWSSVKGGVLMNGGGESTSFMERGCAIEQWVCACVLRPVLWLWCLLFLFFLRSLPKKSQCPPQVYPPFSNRVCVLRNVSGLSRRLRPERLSNLLPSSDFCSLCWSVLCRGAWCTTRSTPFSITGGWKTGSLVWLSRVLLKPSLLSEAFKVSLTNWREVHRNGLQLPMSNWEGHDFLISNRAHSKLYCLGICHELYVLQLLHLTFCA